MPVVTVSSIGRTSYSGRIRLASMKESGDTEYTAGVVLGWNWEGVTTTNDEDERDEEKKACRTRGYRKMSLEVLKYRNSERDNSISITYYPAYSYFAGPGDHGFVKMDEDTDRNKNKRIIEG